MLSRVVYGFVWLLSLLPLRVLYLFADVCYVLLYYVVGYRRKVVMMNLKNSFPDKTEDELRKIAKGFYHHLCDFFVESYRMWHMSADEIKRRCRYNSLFQISTIHSFAWDLICSHTEDIRTWLKSDVSKEITDAETKLASNRNKGTKTYKQTEKKLNKLKKKIAIFGFCKTFYL